MILQMDPDASTVFLGLFIASQPLAQLFFSPLMGWLSQKLGSIRILSMVSSLIMAVGFAFFACISAFPEPRRWWMFASRFVIGAAAGSITLCFSYMGTATTIKERTTAISLFQMCQAVALVTGPLVQAAFAGLGYPGKCVDDDEDKLCFNVYTAPSWLIVIMSVLVALLYLPFFFTEFSIAKEEGEFLAARNLKIKKEEAAKKGELLQVDEGAKLRAPDRMSLIACIVIFGAVQFNFVFIESIATLLTIEQLGWEELDAVRKIGIGLSIAGVYSGIIFVLVGPISRKIGERVVLLLGLCIMLLGPIALYRKFSSTFFLFFKLL